MEMNELLQAIGQMMDDKLEPIKQELNRLDDKITETNERTDRRIDQLEDKIAEVSERTNNKIDGLTSYIDRNNVVLAELITNALEDTEIRILKKKAL